MKLPIRISMILAILVTTGLFSGVQAQKLFFLFAHGQYLTPIDKDLKNAYNFGAGAEGGAGIGLGKTFLTGTIGYSVFDAKKGTGLSNLTMVPMKLGLRHYFLPMNLIYIHADAGVVNLKAKGSDSQSRFTGDIGAGVKLGPLEAGIAYDGFSKKDPSGYASWLAFKVGWRMGL
jgi:hypothetical protein